MDSEDTFIAAMDAAQEYLGLQQQLAEELRRGFMNLAVARYGMGPDRVSLAQLPLSMVATVKVQQGEDNELRLNSAREILDAAAASPQQTTAQDAGSHAIAKDDIIAQLGSKYGCDFSRNSDTGEELEPIGAKGFSNPISWYGTMVSPALRHTQEDFSAALHTIVQLVNVQCRLRDKLDTFKREPMKQKE